MACDICGCNDKPLEDLNKSYATKSIKQICAGCSKEVNDKMWEIREVQHRMLTHLLKRFMRFKRRFK